MADTQSKIVLITGGNRGLGRSTALAAAARGIENRWLTGQRIEVSGGMFL